MSEAELTLPLRALYDLLPPPGAKWSPEKRRTWLTVAEGIFGLIYHDLPALSAAPEEDA